MSHKRKVEDNKRLKKLYNDTKGRFRGAWYNEEKGRYVKADYTSPWLKNQSHRLTRRRLKNAPCHYERGHFKKTFDYWWKLI